MFVSKHRKNTFNNKLSGQKYSHVTCTNACNTTIIVTSVSRDQSVIYPTHFSVCLSVVSNTKRPWSVSVAGLVYMYIVATCSWFMSWGHASNMKCSPFYLLRESEGWWLIETAAYRYEPRHDKANKVSERPAKTQICLGIRPVWSESSLYAWRKLWSLATQWAHSEDSDQTGRTLTLLVLSCRGSYSVPVLVLQGKCLKRCLFYCRSKNEDEAHTSLVCDNRDNTFIISIKNTANTKACGDLRQLNNYCIIGCVKRCSMKG